MLAPLFFGLLLGRGAEGGQEVVVAGGGDVEIAEFAAMDRYYVSEPQEDVRKIVGQDSLHFASEGFAFFLV
jgi:hypothetical protein